jgi:stringent starvation protein B
MKLGNEYVEFKARFGGTSRDIVVPVDHVIAIYARENGQGMAFPAPTEAHVPSAVEPPGGEAGPSGERAAPAGGLRLASTDRPPQPQTQPQPADVERDAGDDETPPEPPAPGTGRPSLKRIK